MAMNCVDELLSHTADAFEAGLNTENREMLEALITQGNTPGVLREINSMPGYRVQIQVKHE